MPLIINLSTWKMLKKGRSKQKVNLLLDIEIREFISTRRYKAQTKKSVVCSKSSINRDFGGRNFLYLIEAFKNIIIWLPWQSWGGYCYAQISTMKAPFSSVKRYFSRFDRWLGSRANVKCVRSILLPIFHVVRIYYFYCFFSSILDLISTKRTVT